MHEKTTAMDKSDLDVLEYLVEYSGLLDGTSFEVAEKVLFDGSLEDLDALERKTWESALRPLLTPDCKGSDSTVCPAKQQIESAQALACYQSGIFLCQDCQHYGEMRAVS